MIVSGRVRYHDALAPFLAPIDTARLDPDNDNNGDVEAIGESIDENGMCDIVHYQKSSGKIISGNHTWTTLKERGAEVAPLLPLDVDDVTAAKLSIALNQIPRLARPDPGLRLKRLQEIAERDTLRGTGISEHHMEVLEKLAEMTPSYEIASWPLLQFRLHPTYYKAFREYTDECDTDAERLELLMRMAGVL